jgi:hypothetical protein
VHDVAAADDQHSLPPQRRQARAQLEVVVPVLRRVDGQLDHGDVGRGEHVRQNRPGAVVEPPRVEVLAHPPRLDDLGDLLGQLRQAGPGYWISSSRGTLAKKSWIVRGCAMAVTAVALMYQCAEMTSTARGRGTVSPSTRHALVKRLRSNVFIGLPCPMNAAGINSST